MALKKKTGDVSGEQMAVEQGEVLTTDDFLSQVKKAAAKGATKGRIVSRLVSMLVFFAIVIGGSHYIKAQIKAMLSPENLFAVEEDVEDHDLTIDNQGILGYTVADFQNAIIEDAKKDSRLIVYSAKVSDVTKITDAGLLSLAVFSKHQFITYNGTVEYYIRLSDITKSDIELDKKTNTITMYIPGVLQGEINIPSEKIKFGDVEKGIFAFGDIKMTPEDAAKVETEAKQKMKDKLRVENYSAEAERYAKAIVLETYQPVIKKVSSQYSLQVKFRSEKKHG